MGVKEATWDLNQMIRVIELCGPDFLVTSGDDGLTLPLLSVGGAGFISVAANIIPRRVVEMWGAGESGDPKTCAKLFMALMPFFRSLFLETNPIPLKFMMGLTGRMTGEVRLPMCPPSEGVQKALREMAAKWGLIPSG